MKNKVVIFDLDGTAIDSPKHKVPTKKLVTAIDQLKERYYLSAATGRVWSFAKPVLQSLRLGDPSIISAGTQICDPRSGKILSQKNISEKALNNAISIFKQYPEYKLLHNDGTENDYFFGGVYPKKFVNKEPVYFLEQVFVPVRIAEEIYARLNSLDGITCVMVVAQKTGCRDLHVVNSKATKEHAVAELLRLLGIPKKNSIGIGDGHNDIHLFNAVGYRIAMGNAAPELKDLADKVIGSVKEAGLVKYLQSLIRD